MFGLLIYRKKHLSYEQTCGVGKYMYKMCWNIREGGLKES